MASKYAEYDARADEADRRITELAARVAAMGSGGNSSKEAELQATIKTLEAKIKKLEAENAGLKKQAAGGKKEKKEKAPKSPKQKGQEKKKGGGKKEEEKAKEEAKLFKAAKKEGGKKAQDICGLNEMGGVVFFHLAIADSHGRWDLLEETMQGFNAEIDPEADDRKGGAAHLCKALLSAADNILLMYVHVPAAHAEKTSAKEWAAALMQGMGPKAKVLESKGEFTKIECPADPDANLFPLKMRDQAIGQGFGFLRERKLVLADDSDDDVDYGEMAAGADISWSSGDY